VLCAIHLSFGAKVPRFSGISQGMRWLLLAFAVAGCAERPIPLPEPPVDLGNRCDPASGCIANGCRCVNSADCCGGECDPDLNFCKTLYTPDLSSTDLSCPPDCVPLGGMCTINADCCPGVACFIPVGATWGACGFQVVPDMGDCFCRACGDACLTSGSCCSTNADCCSGKCEVAPCSVITVCS
jgi:hypothetical protein